MQAEEALKDLTSYYADSIGPVQQQHDEVDARLKATTKQEHELDARLAKEKVRLWKTLHVLQSLCHCCCRSTPPIDRC